MTGKPNPSPATHVSRKRSPLPAAVAVAGLLCAGLCGGGGFQAVTASRAGRVADQISRVSRDGLWLHAVAGSRPRGEWQPVLSAMEADWPSLRAAAPSAVRPLDHSWRVFDKFLQSQGRVGWAATAKFTDAADAEASALTESARRRQSASVRLVAAGAGGLFLCFLGSLGLSRRQRLTQFQTTQGYLAAERASWDKQRSLFDAQRDRLIAELQQAQQHKQELDTLRQHGSRQFEEFFRTLPVACFCVAASGKIVRWNSACEALYGWTAADVLDRTLWETVVAPDEREGVEAQFARVLAGETLGEIDRHDRHATGALMDVRCSLAPVRDASGQIIGCLSANLAATDLKSYEQQIDAQQESLRELQRLLKAQQEEVQTLQAEHEASVLAAAAPSPELLAACAEDRPVRDAITGLRTHGDFQEHVRAEFDRLARYNTPASLVLIDLDQFAAYNESFGYRAGDQALRDVAELLNTKVRSVDIIARYGADEFAILLPETGRTGALIAAERFRAGIAGIAWAGRPLTASLSIAVLTPDLPHPQAFVARAVTALRDSAGSGPNRTVCADDFPVDESQQPPSRSRSRRD